MAPRTRPIPTAISGASCQGRPWLTMRSVKTTPISANIEPTESSMPPVMMTSPSPMLNRPNRPIRLAMLTRLTGDRKRGLIDAVIAADDQDQDEEAEVLLVHRPPPLKRPLVADGELQHVVLAELRRARGSR